MKHRIDHTPVVRLSAVGERADALHALTAMSEALPRALHDLRLVYGSLDRIR